MPALVFDGDLRFLIGHSDGLARIMLRWVIWTRGLTTSNEA